MAVLHENGIDLNLTENTRKWAVRKEFQWQQFFPYKTECLGLLYETQYHGIIIPNKVRTRNVWCMKIKHETKKLV